MNFFSRLFGSKKEPIRSTEPVQFTETVRVSVDDGLSASFFRKDGKSWPGVLWMVYCVTGNQKYSFPVRTYYSKNPPNEKEMTALAEKAAAYISEKIARREPISREELHIIEE